MTIYAFNDPNEKWKKYVADSLLFDGKSKFGWSYFRSANLLDLEDKPWSEMSEEEIETWNKTNFLLEIKEGDWVVHINVPTWGQCITGRVKEKYFFEDDPTDKKDFRHTLLLDKDTVMQFDRNNEAIHPLISRRFKLRGRFWRIYDQEAFLMSINNLKNGINKIDENDSHGLFHLKNEIQSTFKDLTLKIHRTHPEKKLEYFFCNIFKNIPNVTEATVNGSGWGTDFGADIIVKYISGLPLLNLQKEETLVIQVKSYQGLHNDTHCVDQLRTAIEKFKAHSGLIITTATASEFLEKAVEELSNELNKPIGLMAGEDVAKFLLKYENGLLFSI